MFIPSRKQEIYEIAQVKVGGKPGELPTVLIGTMFHRGHSIVKDSLKGVFDREKAEELIKRQEELSDKTGNPCMVSVVGETSDALIKYIDFVANVTEKPIVIEGLTSEVRIAATRYVGEVGLTERVVYATINYAVTPGELEAIDEAKVKAAIIQTFNPKNPWPEGGLEMIAGLNGKGGLLRMVRRAGVDKPLILATLLDIPSIGLACKTVQLVKERLGLPSGVAPLGVVEEWVKSGRGLKLTCRGATLAYVQASGVNFIIYGSIGKAPTVFPTVAMVDAITAYTMRKYGVRPLTRKHPLYMIF